MDISNLATGANPSLRLGGYTLNVEEAWNFRATQIFDELDRAISPGDDDLRKMLDLIKDLCPPDGTIYADTQLRPPQAIARTVVPNYQEGESKFDIEEHDFNNDGIPYWGLCDVLGRLISLLAHVPKHATKDNYYVHITALYGRWCYTLIQNSKRVLPFMFCSVWVTDGVGGAVKLFLGASMGRSTNSAKAKSPWTLQIQRARFELLDVEHMELSGYDLYMSPAGELAGDDLYMSPAGELARHDEPIKLGNCAETYPFAYLDSDKTDLWENAHGLALDKLVITLHDNYNVNDIISHIRGPCPNCQWYIESRGGRSGNFERKKEVKGEGKKEQQHYEAGI